MSSLRGTPYPIGVELLPASAAICSGGSLAIRPSSVRFDPWSSIWVVSVVVAGVVLPTNVSPSLLLALAVVAGLPHGAADFNEGRRAFRSFGAYWWRPFLLGYLGLIGCVLAAWWLCPAITLVAFLALSVVHFGTQDQHAGRSWMSILALGGAPIVGPAVFHRTDVKHLFAVLAGGDANAITAAIAGPLAMAWLVAVVLTMAAAWKSAERSWSYPAELLLTTMLFAFASPLVAFAFYFALIHTPRALIAQRVAAGGIPSLKQMLTLTALACVLGAGVFTARPALALEANVVRTAFMLLAALTVPHMALDYLQPMRRSMFQSSISRRAISGNVDASKSGTRMACE